MCGPPRSPIYAKLLSVLRCELSGTVIDVLARMHACYLSRIVSGVALGAALITASACSSEQSREALAVREFHQRLDSGRVDLIYANSSEFLKGQLSEAQFRHFLAETKRLGRLQRAERAHYDRTTSAHGPEIVLAFYNSRYAKASCLESFSWRVEQDALKLAAYSCAPNMKVSCSQATGTSACETSPAPTQTSTTALSLP